MVSDIILGYIPDGNKFKYGIVFYKSASFDQSIFRDASMYSMTTEPDGSLDYNADASRLSLMNISDEYKMNVWFTSGVQIYGAGVTAVNNLPRFRIVFAYIGLAEAKNVKTVLFTVDNKLYQFTVPDSYISSYKRDDGLYYYHCCLMMGYKNAEFMEALINTNQEVKIEARGDGFNISFSFNEDLRKPVAEDWNNFKQAGGLAPFYGLAADETPMTIY